jgi:hypothetical protein
MVEVRFRPDGKPEEQRVRDRLKPSSSPDAVSSQVKMGDGPTRVIHTTHHAGHQALHTNPHGSKSLIDDTGNMKAPTAGGQIMGHRKGERQ